MLLPCYTTQRRPSRHTVSIPCQVVRERDFRLVADHILNLSAQGMLVGPADPVLTGERLIVSFKTPLWGIWIDAEAAVTRVLHGRRLGEKTRALGVAFDGIDSWSRFVIEKSLVWAPLVPPAARRQDRHALDRLGLLVRRSGLRCKVAGPSFNAECSY